ncbi:MAG: hypothetical protein FVQ80_06330 [Planctomycetes bacterium]|nr:hypothetical protein [Planctomycetota bacterium]
MSKDSRPKTAEAVISFAILIILTLIAAAVLRLQANPDISRFGIEDPADSPKATESFDLTSLAPKNFKPIAKTKIYTDDNLYEKINGKAPLYTEAGFKKLHSQQFIHSTDDTAIIDIYLYHMTNAKSAFAVFSQQRRPNSKPITFQHQIFGYKTTNGVYFIKAQYYIEVVISVASDNALTDVINIGKKLFKKIPQTKLTHFEEIALFPNGNLNTKTITYSIDDPFGFGILSNTFTAEYQIDGQTMLAFISKQQTPEQAVKIVQNYKQFLLENDAIKINPSLFDLDGMFEAVHAEGKFAIGIHAAENKNHADTVAKKLIEKVKSHGK